MRTFINWFLSGFAILFAIPSFLIMISWNALPGDKLYSLKTGLEDITLVATLKTPLASTLSVKYTDRRFSEASLLLAKKGSSVGYNLLVAEANQSKDIIVQSNNTKSGAELVAKIDEYQKNIEQKKIAIQTGGIQVPVSQTSSTNKVTTKTTTTTQATTTPFATLSPSQTPHPTSTPYVPGQTATPTPASPVVTQTPPPVIEAQTEQEVLDNLDQTNQQLQEIKDQINNLPANANFNAQDHNQENQQKKNEKSNSNDNNQKDNNSRNSHN